MRRALFFIVVILILVGSGFLTFQLSRNPGTGVLPGMRIQTDNPSASVLVATGEKGTLFLLFAGFVLFNLVGMGATIAIVVWFLNKQVNKAKTLPNTEFTRGELTAVLARRPAITIGVVIVLVLGAAMTAALFGLFNPR